MQLRVRGILSEFKLKFKILKISAKQELVLTRILHTRVREPSWGRQHKIKGIF